MKVESMVKGVRSKGGKKDIRMIKIWGVFSDMKVAVRLSCLPPQKGARIRSIPADQCHGYLSSLFT